MREEMVGIAMEELRGSSQDIRGCALVSLDGQILASSLKQGLEPARVGTMSLAALKLGEEAAGGLGCGAFKQFTLKGESGYVVTIRVGEDALLSIITGPSAKLGLVLQDAWRAVSSITAAQ